MNKYLNFKSSVIVFCVLALFACNQNRINNTDVDIDPKEEVGCQQNSEHESNETVYFSECAEVVFSSKLTALPFDFEELLEWSDVIDAMGLETNDGRYNWMLLSENESLKQLVDAVYPQYQNSTYFILKSEKTYATMYVVVSIKTEEVGSYYTLINVQDNEIIDFLLLKSPLLGDRSKRQSFNISENLEITLFDLDIAFVEDGLACGDDEEVRFVPVIVGKQITGRYQIQRDGRIVKMDGLN